LITPEIIVPMILDWFSTPPNSYFGSSYGYILNKFLLQPLSTPLADALLNKLKTDIPVLAMLSSNELYIVSSDNGFEQKVISLVLGNDISINLNDLNSRITSGGTFNANAS